MIANRVLVDTGPLVALLNGKDAAHAQCAEAARSLVLPMVTSWVVLAEVAWLLRGTKQGSASVLRLLDGGVIDCPELDSRAPSWMVDCFAKYADLDPQLADVTLLYLADREQIDSVFTLDRRDFSVYRNRQDRPFAILPAQ